MPVVDGLGGASPVAGELGTGGLRNGRSRIIGPVGERAPVRVYRDGSRYG